MVSDNEIRDRASKFDLLRSNWKDPIWWRDVVLRKIVQPMMDSRNNGTYVVDESWNSLIVLDACRYDVFRESLPGTNLQGRLERRTSRATDTGNFLIRNFVHRKSDDIVYVSANPFADKFIKDKVFKLISVWRTHWNEEHDTVLPESMYKCTVEASKQYPDKRIVAHFIQPHYPYIGFKELNVSKFISAKPNYNQSKGGGHKDTSFFTLAAKRIDAEAMMDVPKYLKAYTQNLRIALPFVEQLVRDLPGKTVITADHGEAFGEKISRFLPIRVYGHMPRMRIKSLTMVPWFVVEPQEKIRVRADSGFRGDSLNARREVIERDNLMNV